MAKSGRGDHLRHAVRALENAHGPIDALAAAREVREAAEALERDAIRSARAEGVSWARIGALYGLTKQGAQQRFKAAPAESTSPDAP